MYIVLPHKQTQDRAHRVVTGIAHPIHALAALSNREIDTGGELGGEVPRAPVDAVLYMYIDRRQISFIYADEEVGERKRTGGPIRMAFVALVPIAEFSGGLVWDAEAPELASCMDAQKWYNDLEYIKNMGAPADSGVQPTLRCVSSPARTTTSSLTKSPNIPRDKEVF